MAGSFQAADAALNAFFPGNPPGVRQAAVSLGLRRIVARLTADVTANSTTFANVSDLSFQVEAGRRYAFRMFLPALSDATGGAKVDFAGGSATVTSIRGVARLTTASAVATVAQTALNTSLGGAAAHTMLEVEGELLASATGTVTVRYAQQAANATSTIYAGGRIEVEDITT